MPRLSVFVPIMLSRIDLLIVGLDRTTLNPCALNSPSTCTITCIVVWWWFSLSAFALALETREVAGAWARLWTVFCFLTFWQLICCWWEVLHVFLGKDGRRIPANAPPSTAGATFDAVDGRAGVIVQAGDQFCAFGWAKRVKRVAAAAAATSGGGGVPFSNFCNLPATLLDKDLIFRLLLGLPFCFHSSREFHSHVGVRVVLASQEEFGCWLCTCINAILLPLRGHFQHPTEKRLCGEVHDIKKGNACKKVPL